MKASPVVHFEMPAKNRERVKDFYSKVFNWQMTQLGSEMGNYVLAGTTEVDENNMAKEPGAINGGFYDYNPKDENSKAPHLVISVEDLKKSMEDVKKAGGKLHGEPMDIPGIGTFIMFSDTEDNRVGMLQPIPMDGSK